MAIADLSGWQWIDSAFGRQNAKVYFYVVQGLLGAMLALSIVYFIGKEATDGQKIALFILSVYIATEEVLVALCGTSFYWFSSAKEPVSSLCEKDHAWPWGVVILSFLIVVWYLRGRK